MEPKGSLPSLQQPAIGSCVETHESSPHPHTLKFILILSHLHLFLTTNFFPLVFKPKLINSKVTPMLYFNWAPHREGILEEWRYSSMHSRISALNGGQWSPVRSRKKPLVPNG